MGIEVKENHKDSVGMIFCKLRLGRESQSWGEMGPEVLTPNWPRDPELFLDRSDARNNRVRNNHPT